MAEQIEMSCGRYWTVYSWEIFFNVWCHFGYKTLKWNNKKKVSGYGELRRCKIIIADKKCKKKKKMDAFQWGGHRYVKW